MVKIATFAKRQNVRFHSKENEQIDNSAEIETSNNEKKIIETPMKTYSLHFKASGKLIVAPIICEVLQGKSSLSYKVMVDEEITNWLRKEKLNAKSTSILDIILLNDSKKVMFSQGNWTDTNSIEIKSFDKHSNSDLIY